MAITYAADSPYSTTPIVNNRLDLMSYRKFSFEPDDMVYTIDQLYNNRPDLLAHDLYGRSAFWWVFAVRNPDVIVDPVWDFTTGTTIYLPQLSTLVKSMDG